MSLASGGHDAYAALRIPAVRRYIIGRIAWALGSQMLATAVGWQIYERTRSVLALGLIGLVQVVPVVALALPAGRLVDRRNRKDVALLTVALHALCALAFVGYSVLHAPVWSAYLIFFVQGVATSAGGPATSALFAQICPPEHFVNANAWRSSSFQLSATVGPALAGFTIAASGGASIVYVLDAVAVLGFLGVLLSLPRPPLPPRHAGDEDGTPGAAARELRAGLRFVFATDLLLAAITLDLFAVLFGGATALLPVYARDVLHVGPLGLGWLRAAPAVGALAMALVTTRLPPWQRSGRVLLWTVAGFGAATLVFGLSRWFWLSWLMLMLTGVFDNISVVIRMTLEQLVVPEALRGRVSAVHNVFIGLSNEMGEFESGVAAWAVGPVLAVAGGGLGTLLVVGFVAWRWPGLRRLGRLSELRPATTPLA